MNPPVVPDVQKAWVEIAQGTPEHALQLKSDWPVAKQLVPGDVLVKIQAAALNPAGYQMLKLLPNFLARRPIVPEFDFTGVIVDSRDSEHKVGDEVFGFIIYQWRFYSKTKSGALAEYICVPGKFVMKRPSNISPIEAAGLGLAGMTAFQALDEAMLEEGQTLLVNGGSTSVGSFAIQIAKARGAKVVAVASGRNEQYVVDLGADEFIDYTKVGPLHEYLTNNPPSPKYNVILEAVGIYDPSLYTFGTSYLAPNGAFISVGPEPERLLSLKTVWDTLRLLSVRLLPSVLTGYTASYHSTLVEHDRKRYAEFHRLLEQGKVKPLVDSAYAFEDALNGYDRLKTYRATGKVVIKVSI
ncbi:NAD(P)-binding protein [Coprinopsis marcescibilis]|uniref:NAD(P)-binding protein n=1 Tax=Coprinopsis marcescibilis TaxID=230819 RepID=A0A5C3L468_COPMA|nr:NAD(P)-binding protein [Coprinopsis marcescibilis]